MLRFIPDQVPDTVLHMCNYTSQNLPSVLIDHAQRIVVYVLLHGNSRDLDEALQILQKQTMCPSESILKAVLPSILSELIFKAGESETGKNR